MHSAALVSGVSSLTLHEQGFNRIGFCASFLGSKINAEIKNCAEFAKNLAAIRLVYKIAYEAMQALTEQNYHHFDALVSDCACQLRALYVCMVARRLGSDAQFRAECTQTKQTFLAQIEQVDKVATLLSTPFRKSSLHSLISQHALDTTAREEFIFCAQSYVLCRTKEVINCQVGCSVCHTDIPTTREVTNADKINDANYPVATCVIEQIVKQVKARLSAQSVSFIQEQARTYPDFFARLTGINVREIQGRKELPCAYSLHFVMIKAQAENIPIMLRVQRAFHTVEDRIPVYDVTITSRKVTDRNEPIIVIEGRRLVLQTKPESMAEYRHRLSQYSICQLTELNAIQHSQYTGGGNEGIECIPACSTDTKEYERLAALKAKADAVGCSLSNQSLLLMTHVFASTYAKVMAAVGGECEPA